MPTNDDNDTVLYEVNLEADAAIEGPFDTWLRDHVADMLQLEGFLSAEILGDAAPTPGRVRRIVQYRLRDQPALDCYLRDHAPRMREHGVALFGDRFSADRRVLAHREEFIRGKVSTENCLNCGEVLTGQHCSHCGQRATVRVLSLASLLRDLFGDFTNFDSRVWRTLKPLAFKPGWLTSEYLRGRRALYTPPFRMYLILSVAFFLATTIGADPGGGIRLDLDGDGASLEVPGAGAPETGAVRATAGSGTGTATDGAGSSAPPPVKLEPERQKLVDAIVSRLPDVKEREDVRRELELELARMPARDVEPLRRLVSDPCSPQNFQLEGVPALERYEPRLRDACRRIVTDSRGFGRALYQNLPKMMFIFLPLIAAVMFVLYLGSRRYYVEHLLFFVHYHAFFFLAGLVVVLLDRVAGLLQPMAVADWLKAAEALLTTLLVVYVPCYLYRAMRRVYAQGRALTLFKYGLLGIGYVFFMVLTAAGLLFYTALTL